MRYFVRRRRKILIRYVSRYTQPRTLIRQQKLYRKLLKE